MKKRAASIACRDRGVCERLVGLLTRLDSGCSHWESQSLAPPPPPLISDWKRSANVQLFVIYYIYRTLFIWYRRLECPSVTVDHLSTLE